jgi:hypothetical protein
MSFGMKQLVGRMLKKSASIVLGSSKSSTYPRGYASGFDSPCILVLTRQPDSVVPNRDVLGRFA